MFRGVLDPNLTPGPGLVVTLERLTESPVDVTIPDGAAVFAGSLLPMGAWQFSPSSPPEWIEAEPQSVRSLIDD